MRRFTLYSFGDLHRVVCALPKLRVLYLAFGRLASLPDLLPVMTAFDASNAPRLNKLHLHDLEPSFLSLG